MAMPLSSAIESQDYQLQQTQDEFCWICLDDVPDRKELVQPCRCPRRVHSKCLARWQLQQAGRPEEKKCRFCNSTLADWKSSLTPDPLKSVVDKVQPVMVVYFEGEIHRIPVKQGDEGLHEFTNRIRELFRLPEDVDISLTFGCKEPMSGQHLKLEGMGAFDAAVHCASIAAAERQLKIRSSGGAASSISTGGGPGLGLDSGTEDNVHLEDEDQALLINNLESECYGPEQECPPVPPQSSIMRTESFNQWRAPQLHSHLGHEYHNPFLSKPPHNRSHGWSHPGSLYRNQQHQQVQDATDNSHLNQFSYPHGNDEDTHPQNLEPLGLPYSPFQNYAPSEQHPREDVMRHVHQTILGGGMQYILPSMEPSLLIPPTLSEALSGGISGGTSLNSSPGYPPEMPFDNSPRISRPSGSHTTESLSDHTSMLPEVISSYGLGNSRRACRSNSQFGDEEPQEALMHHDMYNCEPTSIQGHSSSGLTTRIRSSLQRFSCKIARLVYQQQQVANGSLLLIPTADTTPSGGSNVMNRVQPR